MKDLKMKYKDLVFKYIIGEISDDDKSYLESEIKSSRENEKYFQEIDKIYSDPYDSPKDYVFNIDKAWDNLSQRMERSVNMIKSKRLILTKRLIIWKWAAVIVLLIGLTFSSLYLSDTKRMVYTFFAQKGQKSNVLLADGSTVWLNSGSSITINDRFNKKHRVVELQGEAFFDIAKDEDNPFIVSTSQLDIKVMGTKFNVSAYKDDINITTTLEEGKVTVINKTGKYSPLTLQPGEQILYNKNKKISEVKKVNTNLYTSWKDNLLKFDNAPFVDVVKKLERWFDIRIVLQDDLKYTERYTMTIKTESLREVLELLKITTPFQYKIDKDIVLIQSQN